MNFASCSLVFMQHDIFRFLFCLQEVSQPPEVMKTGTMKACPFCGKRFKSKLYRHFCHCHPNLIKKYGKEKMLAVSEKVTTFTGRGASLYPSSVLDNFLRSDAVVEEFSKLGIYFLEDGATPDDAIHFRVQRRRPPQP